MRTPPRFISALTVMLIALPLTLGAGCDEHSRPVKCDHPGEPTKIAGCFR